VTPPIDEAVLDVNVALELLNNPRRRAVIKVLSNVDYITESDLVDEVVAYEDTNDDTDSSKHRRSTYIALHQVHLDKLADAGVIELDRDSDTTEITPRESLTTMAGILSNIEAELDKLNQPT
jgi:DNA-binding transcriptional ArsR family regulator